jgi:hypothetical protein
MYVHLRYASVVIGMGLSLMSASRAFGQTTTPPQQGTPEPQTQSPQAQKPTDPKAQAPQKPEPPPNIPLFPKYRRGLYKNGWASG